MLNQISRLPSRCTLYIFAGNARNGIWNLYTAKAVL